MRFIYKLRPFNRRKHKRFEPFRLVKISCVYADSGKEAEVFPDILDISQGGLLMATKDKIYPGKDIEFRFNLPGQKEVVKFNAQIMRTYRKHGYSWYFSGVKFLDNAQEGIKILLDYALGK